MYDKLSYLIGCYFVHFWSAVADVHCYNCYDCCCLELA